MTHIVFVESPNKKNKLNNIFEKYFSKDRWIVFPTFGHIKNLPTTKYSLSFSGNKYYADFHENENWKALKKNINKIIEEEGISNIDFYIASDLDREGEVIAHDILESLNIDFSKAKRVVFNSMKKETLIDAFTNPVPFNMNFKDAGIARRVIDRDVGYLLSTFMREDFIKRFGDADMASGIGRTSAPSLNLLALKYYNLIMFSPEKYYKIILNFSHNGKIFNALLDEEFDESEKERADNILNDILYSGKNFTVSGFNEENELLKPPSPLDNTSMLYAGWYLYRFNEKKTMQLAQSLFEKEYITYHRSDSVELSSESINSIVKFIYDEIDPNFLPATPNIFKNKETSQEGHEAITPTSFSNTYSPTFLQKTSLVSDTEGYIGDMQSITKDEFSLYTLIWNRAIASQMKPAIIDKSMLSIKNGERYFFATRKLLLEKGWLDFFGEYILNSTEGNSDFLTKFRKNDFDRIDLEKELKLKDASILERETEAPKRYGKGQFVRAISNKGIGRPSTLYLIPNELLSKEYANSDENGIIEISDDGLMVIEWLLEVVPELLDDKFIKEFEKNLNKIAEGKLEQAEYILEIHNWLLSVAKKNRYNLHIIEESANISSIKEKPVKPDDSSLEKTNSRNIEKISDCGFCGNGEIVYDEENFKCTDCDFFISVERVRNFIERLGKTVDALFISRAIEKSLKSGLPLFIPKIKSKKGKLYDGNFTFTKNGNFWGLEFFKDESSKKNGDNNNSEVPNSEENKKEISNHSEEQRMSSAEPTDKIFSQDEFFIHLEYFCNEESDETYIFLLKINNLEQLRSEISEFYNCAFYELEQFVAIIATNFDENDSEEFHDILLQFDSNSKSSDLVQHVTIEKQFANLRTLYETNSEKKSIRLKEETIS